MLHLRNKIKASHTTSACDIIKETMSYYHISVNKLALETKINKNRLSKALERKLYLTADELTKLGKQLHLSTQLLINLDKSYRNNH